MEDCEYLEKCPVWAKFKSSIKDVWIKNYCQGDKQDRCARKVMGAEGKEVPINLLPNGTELEE